MKTLYTHLVKKFRKAKINFLSHQNFKTSLLHSVGSNKQDQIHSELQKIIFLDNLERENPYTHQVRIVKEVHGHLSIQPEFQNKPPAQCGIIKTGPYPQ